MRSACALHGGIDAGERRGVGGPLQLALPQRPLDRVDRQTGRSDDQAAWQTGEDEHVAALIAPELLQQSQHGKSLKVRDQAEARSARGAAAGCAAGSGRPGAAQGPIRPEERSELEKKVDSFVDELVALDSNSPEFGKKVDQLTAMGRKEIAEAAGASNRFLDRPVKAIDSDTGIGADLTELRRTVEALDPKRNGKR
jgi:hypothetical protein